MNRPRPLIPESFAQPQSLPPPDLATLTRSLQQSRQTVLPKRLVEPGPDAQQLQLILEAAASAPDHGQLLPWRFVLVQASARAALGEAFAQALRERDPEATVEQQAQAREKALRAPLLLLAVVDGTRGDAHIPMTERLLSAGCAIQNMLLMATALGFGSALTSGQAMDASALRNLFKLGDGERALCFVNIGTAQSRKPPRQRPSVNDYLSTLE